MKDQIYILRNPCFSGLKIGYSANLESRVKTLNTSVPSDFEIVATFDVDNGLKIEKIIHRNLKKYRINREFFNLAKDEAVRQVKESIVDAQSEILKSSGMVHREVFNSGDIIEILKRQQRIADVSQLELSNMCNMSVNGLSKLLSSNGSRDPKVSTIFKVSRFLGFKIILSYEME